MPERPGPVEPAPQVVADQAPLRAAAGSPVTAHVTITNLAGAPRVMSLTAHGLDPAWLPPPSRSPALAPGESVGADLVLLPSVGTIAARYPLAIAVQALDPVTGLATGPTALAELVLVVDAPGQIALTLDPTEARAVFGKRIRVELRNDGALPARVDLQAQAPRSARLTLPAGTVDVPPRDAVSVRGRIRPRRVRLFGHRERHAYTVTARSAGAPRHVEGVLTTRAVLGPRTALATALLAVVAVWVALAVVYIPKLADHFRNGNSTVTAQQAAGTGSPSPGAGGSGGSGLGGSGSGGSGSGGSGGSGSGGAHAGADASSVQLNGVVAGSSPDGVTVSLRPTSLVDEAAEGAIGVGVSPASDSEVGLIPAEALAGRAARPAGQHRTVTTTADGAWSFPAVPKPGYYLLTFSKPGFQTVRYIVDSATAAATKPLNVTMSAGQGQLNGVVTGPRGRVGGATITITDGTNTITTSTDSTGDIGSWSVVGLSTPSSYLVSASADGLGTESKLVPLGAGGSASVALTLRAGVGAITGTVRSSAGDQLGGVTVSATDGTITRTATTVTEDGLRGRYTLSGLPAPGKYTITFTAQGFLQQTVKVALGKGQSQVTSDVTLFPASTTVTGTVTSDGGGSSPGPLVGAGLTLTSSDNTYKTTSGDGGAYQFDGVAPGDYVLSAQYAGLTTVYKSLTVAAGTTKPIVIPSFELVTPAKALSTAGIVGFVSDGTNPSNTICPSTPGACTLTFTLRAQDGTAVQLAQNSLASAAAGPTAYTLTPSSGIEPGLYKLTIGATDAGGATKYLPVTVGVQVPLAGIASAPAVSLYPANTIIGSVAPDAGDLTDDGSGTAVTNCVYAVPVGSAAPDLSKPCSKDVVGASNCSVTGAQGPAYAEIRADGTYELDGLCDGIYAVYVAIENAWYEPVANPVLTAAAPSTQRTVTVAKGQTWTIPKIVVNRKAQISLTVNEIPLNGTTAGPFASPQTIQLACNTNVGNPVRISPSTFSTSASPVTIGGLSTSVQTTCTGTIVGVDDLPASSVTFTLSSSTSPNPETLTFHQTVGTIVGRVITTWSDPSGTGVPGGSVTISGTVADGSTQSVTVTPASDGCFAITADGKPPASASIPSPCTAAISTSPAAVKALPLVKDGAEFTVNPPGGYRNLSGSTFPVSRTVSSGTLVTFTVYPGPVTLAGLTLQTDPSTGGSLAGFALEVANDGSGNAEEPPGAGNVTLSVAADGSVTWQDDQFGSTDQIAPGTYTITSADPDYIGSYTFTCTPAGHCTVGDTPDAGNAISSSPFVVDRLANVKINLAEDGGAPFTDTLVSLYRGSTLVDTQTTSGTAVTFDKIVPTKDVPSGAPYWIRVQAAGYQFGDSNGSGAAQVDLVCGSATDPTPTFTLDPGEALTCTATPVRDGAISGQVILVLGTSATADNVQYPAAGTTVTAKSSDGTTITATTIGTDGKFRLTGSSSTQGLDAGSAWNLSASYVGYDDGAQSVTVSSTTADTTTDPAAADPCAAGTTNICLFVKTVTVTVTVTDSRTHGGVSDLSVSLKGRYTGTLAPSSQAAGVYTFNDVIPDLYQASVSGSGFDIKASGFGYADATLDNQSVQFDNGTAGTQTQNFNLQITRNVSTVAGTIVDSTTTDGLAAATVCIVQDASATSCSGAVLGADGSALKTTTDGDGKYAFTTVPDTPSGTHDYIRAERYGFTPAISSLFDVAAPAVPAAVDLALDRVTHTVKITVTGNSTADDLSGSSDATLTSAGSGGTAPDDLPSNATLSNLSITPGASNAFTVTKLQVPYGCWSFDFTQANGHFGALSDPSGGTTGDLSCPSGSFQVPGTGTADVNVSYSLDEADLQVVPGITGPDKASPPDLALTISAGAKTFVNSASVTAGTAYDYWLPSGDSYDLTLTAVGGADQHQWPTDSTTVPSLSVTQTTKATPTIDEAGKVSVTIAGASSTNPATLVISDGADNSLPVPYTNIAPITDTSAQVFYLPAGKWTFTATTSSKSDAANNIAITQAGPNTVTLSVS